MSLFKYSNKRAKDDLPDPNGSLFARVPSVGRSTERYIRIRKLVKYVCVYVYTHTHTYTHTHKGELGYKAIHYATPKSKETRNKILAQACTKDSGKR